jgi:hypothetical protein
MKQFPWQGNWKAFAGWVGVLAIGLIGAGCAGTQQRPSSYLFYGKPPTPEMRTALGRTAIVVATNEVIFCSDRPKSLGAATGHGF